MKLEEITKPHVRQWILEHENDEPAKLMLQAHRFSDIPVKEAVAQIQARQKVRQKLPSWYQQEEVVYPPTLSVEQSSSEETALYKSALVQGFSMADLTGGMGVDTFYLGRNCPEAYYVEQQKELCQVAEYNFRILGAPHIQVINSPAEDFLPKVSFLDFIYLDPARRGEGNTKLYKLADCQPDITRLLPDLLQKASKVLLKAAPMLDIQQGLSELMAVKEVHVVALKNEVKELLFLMEKGFDSQPTIKAVNILPSKAEPFSFTFPEEQAAEASFSEPLRYLYEPHAALLKAGAFKLLTQRYPVFKLHPNSHLYTSGELVKDFPGRAFQILYKGKPDKKALQQFFPEGKALISSRNHPLSVAQLAKKMGLKEGGECFLFATSFQNGKPGILICEKASTEPLI